MSSELIEYFVFRSLDDSIIKTDLNGSIIETYSNIAGGTILLFSVLQTDSDIFLFTVTNNRATLNAFNITDLNNTIWNKSIDYISDITSYSVDNNGTIEYRVVITTGWGGNSGSDYFFNASDGTELHNLPINDAGYAVDHYLDTDGNTKYITFSHGNGLTIRDGLNPLNNLIYKVVPNSEFSSNTGISSLVYNDGSEEIVYAVTSQNVPDASINSRYDIWRVDDNSAGQQLNITQQQSAGTFSVYSWRSPRTDKFLEMVIPNDFKKLVSLTITGKWRDQGWGGTGHNRILLRLRDSNDVQYESKSIEWINRNSDPTYYDNPINYTEVYTSPFSDIEELNNLKPGDKIEMWAYTVSWGGWSTHASNTTIDMTYTSIQPLYRVADQHGHSNGTDLSHSMAAAKTANKLLGFGSGQFNYIDIFDISDGSILTSITLPNHTWGTGKIDAHSNSDGSVTLVAALSSDDFYYWNIIDSGNSITVNEIQHIAGGSGTVNYTEIIGIEAENTLPVIETINITPQAAIVGTLLTANSTTIDANGQNVTVSYQWTLNGNPLNNETNSTLDTTGFSMGDIITVIGTPNDGLDDGTSSESIAITLNTSPSIDNLVIIPTNPTNQDTLSVSFTTFDADGQNVTLSYQWIKNGSNINGQTSASLDPSFFVTNDFIMVTCTPNDGLEDGTPLTSNPVTIVNPTYSIQTDVNEMNIYNDQYITLISNPNDATIYYTLDGSDPTNNSTEYVDPFRIVQTGNVTLKYIAIGQSANTSQIYQINYVVTDWIEHTDFDIDNTRKSVFKTWRTNPSRITNRLDWSTFNVKNEKNTWRKMKRILRKAKKLSEINNGDLISFIPENRTKEISAKVIYDENALNTPNNANELIEHTIISGDNFYIPMDDQENVDSSYWAKLISGTDSQKIKFEYTGSNYLYNILDENLNIIETNSITEDTKLEIGNTVFNLFTGGVGGEDEVNSSDIDNIEDILNTFNCAVKKIQVENARLDAMNKILCLKECMLKVNKKK